MNFLRLITNKTTQNAKQSFLSNFKTNPLTTTSTITYNRRYAHTVRVILTQDVPDQKYYAGEVHHVKAGFARNYLIPQQKAVYATSQNFTRVGLNDPDLQKETKEERFERLKKESDVDVKAANFLKYYLRNKTLKIWRHVDWNVSAKKGGEEGKGSSSSGSASQSIVGTNLPIYPGLVDHKNVREKLATQLKIDLEDNEKVQILKDPVSFASFEEEGGEKKMEDLLNKMEPIKDDEECQVQVKALGEYLVKIHLKGDNAVGLRLAVLKR
mmetsp:Transcript_25360/g.31249  ORF Transcript_25360/g.31249 Transcript_25360/m.31249 type:complete len:269 (-) Transcript_25360:837-1643(-)